MTIPIFGTLACALHNLRASGQPEKADALLKAHNQIRAAFGWPAYNEADDMTDTPHEGGFAIKMGN